MIQTSDPMPPRVCIIGAGATGLCHAYRLSQTSASLRVLETSSRVGGVVQTFQENGFLAEAGPHSLRYKHRAIAHLLDEMGLEEEIVEPTSYAKKRFLVKNSQLLSAPRSPLSLLTTPLLSGRAKLRLLREPWIPPLREGGEESLAAFVSRRLGQEVLEQLLEPMVGGIYAGDPHQLSARYAFPSLYDWENKHGSLIRGAFQSMRQRKKDPQAIPTRIVAFRQGMQTLVDRIAGSLPLNSLRRDVQLQSIEQLALSKAKEGENTAGAEPVWRIRWEEDKRAQSEDFDALFIAVPAFRLKTLPWQGFDHRPWEGLDTIEHPPVTIMTLGFRREDVQHPLDGFGALISAQEGYNILGVIFASSLFPHRAPKDHVTLSVFLGGTRSPERGLASLEIQEAMALQDLRRLLGVSGKVRWRHRMVWSKAIPQYNLGYGRFMQAIEQSEAAYPGLHLVGNYRTGISLAQCLLNGLGSIKK